MKFPEQSTGFCGKAKALEEWATNAADLIWTEKNLIKDDQKLPCFPDMIYGFYKVNYKVVSYRVKHIICGDLIFVGFWQAIINKYLD